MDAPGFLPCIIGCCGAAGCLSCPPPTGSVFNFLLAAELSFSHLVLYAAAAAGFLSRRERLPELVPLPASLTVGLSAPHFGFPLVWSWNSKAHFPWTDCCFFTHCRLGRLIL